MLIFFAMWYPDGIEAENNASTLFLLAAWQELFHAFTPDSHQPRLHNVPSLVTELADLSARCRREPRYQIHVEKIQAELGEALEDERAVASLLPSYESRIRDISKEKSADKIFAGCRIVDDNRRFYEEAIFRVATDAVAALPKRKGDVHESLRRLATIAVQKGKEDNDVWDPLNKDLARSPSTVLEDIFHSLSAGADEFSCVLAFIGAPAEIQSVIRMAGGVPTSRSELSREYVGSISEPSERLSFIRMDVEATSIRDAVSTCRKKIGIATGLANLYQNSRRMQIDPKALVRPAKGTEVIFSQAEQAFRRLHPRANARDDIREGMKLLADRPEVDKHLHGAIELLALATSSTDSRSRLVNMWSSMETLSGGHHGKTTLERVLALVVPLVVSRTVARATRYLAIQTQRLGERLGSINYGSGFTGSTRKYVSPGDMAATLMSPKNAPEICDLLRFAEHPLLRYRIWQTWESFHNPRTLRHVLMKSQRRLEWHIARIYRARNMLVHQGEEPPFLVPLLDNLQGYLSMAIQRLIHELKGHPTWNISHVIEFWNGKVSFVLHALDKCPHVLSLGDFTDSRSAKLIWQA